MNDSVQAKRVQSKCGRLLARGRAPRRSVQRFDRERDALAAADA